MKVTFLLVVFLLRIRVDDSTDNGLPSGNRTYQALEDQSMPSNSSTDRQSASSDDKEVDEIVGGVVGSVVLLAVAYVIVKIRRRTDSEKDSSSSDTSALIDVLDEARNFCGVDEED
ncbi:hypothetical protein ACROYT_G035050 [Oculina patagonica]